MLSLEDLKVVQVNRVVTLLVTGSCDGKKLINTGLSCLRHKWNKSKQHITHVYACNSNIFLLLLLVTKLYKTA